MGDKNIQVEYNLIHFSGYGGVVVGAAVAPTVGLKHTLKGDHALGMGVPVGETIVAGKDRLFRIRDHAAGIGIARTVAEHDTENRCAVTGAGAVAGVDKGGVGLEVHMSGTQTAVTDLGTYALTGITLDRL